MIAPNVHRAGLIGLAVARLAHRTRMPRSTLSRSFFNLVIYQLYRETEFRRGTDLQDTMVGARDMNQREIETPPREPLATVQG